MPNLDAAPILRLSHAAVVSNLRDFAGAGPVELDLRRNAGGLGADRLAETALTVPGVRICTEAERPGPGATSLSTALFGRAPALALVGTVLAIKPLLVDEGVSYGYRYRAPAPTRLALVTGGYAQGIVRSLGGRVDVSVAGVRCRIVGAVAMDVCMVDVAHAEVSVGDQVEFFGAAGLEPWRQATGLTAEELLTMIGLHVRTEHLG